jgi:hypothetical protein
MCEPNNDWEIKTAPKNKLGRKLDAIGWGLFFIWMGIAIQADLGWGVGFLGVGLIILGILGVREYFSGSACSGATKASS